METSYFAGSGSSMLEIGFNNNCIRLIPADLWNRVREYHMVSDEESQERHKEFFTSDLCRELEDYLRTAYGDDVFGKDRSKTLTGLESLSGRVLWTDEMRELNDFELCREDFKGETKCVDYNFNRSVQIPVELWNRINKLTVLGEKRYGLQDKSFWCSDLLDILSDYIRYEYGNEAFDDFESFRDGVVELNGNILRDPDEDYYD